MNSKLIKYVALTPIGWFTLFFLVMPPLFGQFPVYDQPPPSLKWQQINTEGFKLVFPDYFQDEAFRVASLLEEIYEPQSVSLGARPKQIPILFQTENSVPNAFVRLLPRHSQFNTTPPQNYNFLGNADWLDLIAVHEFRHVVQFEKSNTGLPKWLRYFFGNEILSLAGNLGAPDWFWEGDAVFVETAMTPTGRGEIPEFNMQLRTSLLEGREWSYSKFTLTSLKDFVPNHYVTGYFLVTYLNKKYGYDVWDKVTQRSFSFPYMPFAFSLAVKKYTGKNIVKQYLDMADTLTQVWERQAEGTNELPDAFQNRKKKVFTDYLYPTPMDDGRILAVKQGLGDYFQFVTIDSAGHTSHLYTPGFVKDDGFIAYGADKIAWIEYFFHPRFGNENYGVIKILEIETKKIQVIGEQSRYASISIDKSGQRLVAVKSNEDYSSELELIELDRGKSTILKSKEELYFTPRWSPDGQAVVFISLKKGRKKLEIIDLNTKERSVVFEAGNENIGLPNWESGYIFYNSPYSGIDNVYVTDVETNKRYRVTNERYGAFNASYDGHSLYFNNHTVLGQDIVKTAINKDVWEPIEEVEVKTIDFNEGATHEALHFDVHEVETRTDFTIEKYRSPLINPLAWNLLSGSTLNEVEIGLKSRNILNTSIFSAGYAYSLLGESGYVFGRYSFQKYFPIFDLEFNEGTRFAQFSQGNQTIPENWRETSIRGGVRLPLNLTKSRFSESLAFGFQGQYTFISNFDSERILLSQTSNGTLAGFTFSVDYNLLHKVSPRDFVSKWGFVAWADYKSTVPNSDFSGQMMTLQTSSFLPGFFRHHSVNIRAGFQRIPNMSYDFDIERDSIGNPVSASPRFASNLYIFPSRFFFPRGGDYRVADVYYTTGISYELPILYPDLPLWAVAYIQRIRIKPFFDFAYMTTTVDPPPGFRSSGPLVINEYTTGLEVRIDFNLGRRLPMFSVGARLNYDINDQDFSFDFISGNLGL